MATGSDALIFAAPILLPRSGRLEDCTKFKGVLTLIWELDGFVSPVVSTKYFLTWIFALGG
jgi:hypothetical protein